jgi:phage host-nuclease inhibitor protein Gam
MKAKILGAGVVGFILGAAFGMYLFISTNRQNEAIFHEYATCTGDLGDARAEARLNAEAEQRCEKIVNEYKDKIEQMRRQIDQQGNAIHKALREDAEHAK